jgi:hypothetical protein
MRVGTFVFGSDPTGERSSKKPGCRDLNEVAIETILFV